MTTRSLAVLLSAALATAAFAGDWNQWRGPSRTSIADETHLAAAWPKSELPKLWESEKIPGDNRFGFASPIIADGNVFVFVTWQYDVPIDTRTLADNGLRDLGWNPMQLPDDIATKAEAARVSDERAKLKNEQVDAWAKQWVKDNLPADTKKDIQNLAGDRLRRGPKAIDLATLAKLATIKDKPFATQQDLDKWLDENAITGEPRKAVVARIATKIEKTNDTMLCLAGDTGKVLWKKEYAAPLHDWGSSAVPAVVNGKLYATGCGGTYCLNAKDGAEIWHNDLASVNGSVCVVGDLLLVQNVGKARQFMALNIADGKTVWTQPKAAGENASPVLWQDGPDTYALCNDGQKLSCVSVKDGSILWAVPGTGMSTPAVGDGYVVLQSDKKEVGLLAYKLSKEAPAKAWSAGPANRGASAMIYKGHAYAQGGGNVTCVELATGKVAWEVKHGSDEFSTPVVADGRVFSCGQGLAIVAADPAAAKLQAEIKLPFLRCTTPAIANGKMIIRTNEKVICYDLVNMPAGQEPNAPAK